MPQSSHSSSSGNTCDCPNGASNTPRRVSTWTLVSMYLNQGSSSSKSSSRRGSQSSRPSSSHSSSSRQSSRRRSTADPDQPSSRPHFRTHRRTPVYTYDKPKSKRSQRSRYYDSTTVFEGDTRWYLSLFNTDSKHRRVWYVFFPTSGKPTDAELVAHLQECAAQVTDPIKALEVSHEATGSGVWVEFATPCFSTPDEALRRLTTALEGLAQGVAKGGQLPIDAGPIPDQIHS
ncbi:hypothetical protein P168DRAFT_282875 [Aspergillus campestris IBT 28561]|uniref:Uncharacterized protein n=1 Tax=Aspergillus campestris (strain IBT 28561) TaxID=1392248 RepID=A0A2I1CZQ2_ASPC2|nr:uncharacterized protein P168DRAFT_282875 [Aspergillus campestris IBT 28561]PKY03103.1 hypothetical protein P168DRAFT_282875 [Aspergillus campestris IBT 28561]